MLVVCKKCKVEHDSRDINSNGFCVWCEQRESVEMIKFQQDQKYFYNYFHKRFDWKSLPCYAKGMRAR